MDVVGYAGPVGAWFDVAGCGKLGCGKLGCGRVRSILIFIIVAD